MERWRDEEMERSRDEMLIFNNQKIWNGTRVVQTLSTQDLGHGKIYKGLKWNPNEKSIAYVAETPSIPSKSSAFFPPTTQTPIVDASSTTFDLSKMGSKFLFAEDFGEQNINNRQSELWIFFLNDLDRIDFPSSTTVPEPWQRSCRVKLSDQRLSVSQPRWTPDGSGLVFVGCFTHRRRLGQMYCWLRLRFSSLLFSSLLFSSHLISSHLFSSLLFSSLLFSSLLFSSHLISSHLISSHLISSHLIPSLLFSSSLIRSDEQSD